MDLFLNRRLYLPEGIFGQILGDQGELLFAGCEHAYYDMKNRTYVPKIPEGVYTCIRGMHRLHKMTTDFETFEITGVPDHTGCLFHVGNTGEDSDGCVLLGETLSLKRITNSRKAFESFMQLQSGVNQFQIVIQDIDSRL